MTYVLKGLSDICGDGRHEGDMAKKEMPGKALLQ